MALVQHLFSEEEAGVVRHLGLLRGRRAEEIARAEHRPRDQIEPILDRLANEKRVIVRSGGRKQGSTPVYRLLPIVPGIFEMMLIVHTPESLTDWHHRFIELFESLYETGYSLDYQQKHPTPSVRYLPVGKAIDAHPMALPPTSSKPSSTSSRYSPWGIASAAWRCRPSAAAAASRWAIAW